MLKIYSGKTHQIRVALKSMGAPILGDSRYAGANQPGSGSRLFLHAWNVRFQWKNQWVEYSAPLDTAWASLAEQLPGSWSQPWRLHWPVHKMQRREE